MTYCFAAVTDPRKRHKKDHEKTWMCEDRKASRRSKGSAGHQHEWSPDNSMEGSPPPSLSDGKI